MNFKINFCALTLMVCLFTYVAAEDKPKMSTTVDMKKPDMDMPIKPATEQKMETMKEAEPEKSTEMKPTNDASVTTVGDFIIHPLVAFRPRPAVTPADADMIEGKQADSSSTTTAAPWPVFGLGYGQAIGSSLSNVAGQISGWLTDRIQMNALETPIRDSTTTTTTTPRPDVIVRVQHRPAITVNDNRKRPTLNNNDIPEDDYEQDENDVEEEEDEEVEEEDEGDYEEEEEIEEVRPQRRPVRRPLRRPQQNQRQPNRRPINNRQQQINRFNDYAEDDSEDDYYYNPQFSSKRSQSNFLNLGNQNLLNQLRLLTRGQTPGQLAETMQQSNPERNHGTFLVRRNGQTVYLAPELIGENEEEGFQLVQEPQAHKFPQPPLTKPLKVNGQVAQYITIPYNQLGLVPPQGASGVAEGIQSQPLILSIPQSALKQLQSKDKNHGPLVTPNAVPLFTEAALADIFKPPQIPPSRTQPGMMQNSGTPLTGSYVVLTPNGGTKIRPSTVVEKSPSSLNIKQVKTEEAYIIVNDDQEEEGRKAKDATQFYQLPKGSRFGLRKGRELDQSHSPAKEETIPVQIVSAVPEKAPEVELPKMMEEDIKMEEIVTPAMEKAAEETAMEAQIEPTPAPKTMKTAETQA